MTSVLQPASAIDGVHRPRLDSLTVASTSINERTSEGTLDVICNPNAGPSVKRQSRHD